MSENEDSVEGGILEGVPNISQYQYKGLQNFWSLVALEQERFYDEAGTCSPYILFSHVDNKTFTRDFDIINHKSSWRLFDSYYPFSQLLLVRMVTTKDHERAYMRLVDLIIFKLAKMNGANFTLDWTGSADIKTPSRTKKPDQGATPLDLPTGRSDLWPTLIIEAAYSESRAKLQGDAEWWLKASNGDVRIALTIAMHQRKPEIVIRKWGNFHTGQTRTRIQTSPILHQQIVISRPVGQSETVVTNGPLVISFHDLFLRDPSHYEDDILLTESDLRGMAEGIWKRQEFGNAAKGSRS